jgi:uncharacterized protein (DUF433 family)
MISFDAAGTDALTLYGGKDPRDLPRYTYPEAARATGVPASTIAAWVRGQEYTLKEGRGWFRPVITRPTEGRLSFTNLIEVFVLRGLRTMHAVKLAHVRRAIDIAEKEFRIDKLLVSDQLRFDAGHLFLEQYGQLLQLTPAQQFAMREVLEKNLKRIDWISGQPRDFFPRERITETGRKLLLVSPLISFGRPVITRLGVTTRAIADRYDAGEPKESIIDDYGLEQAELTEALAYEADAAAA